MSKKLITSFVVATVLFAAAPVTSLPILTDQHSQVDAKSYRSKRGSFTKPNTTTPRNDQVNRNQNIAPKASPVKRGGIMKGLLYGGLAGFLMGSLLSGLGGLGAILGLLINALGIYILFKIGISVYRNFKKRKEDANPWNR